MNILHSSRHSCLTMVLAGIATFCFAGAAFAKPSKDVEAILKIEHAIANATATSQVEGYFDKDMVFDDMVPGQAVGIEAVKKLADADFKTMTDPKVEFLRIKVVTDGKLAFAYSTQHYMAKLTATGGPLDIVLRQTDCYRKKAGKWYLIYEHVSLPFNWATGKIITDAK